MTDSIPLRQIEQDVFKVKINLNDLSLNNTEVVLSLGYSNIEEPEKQTGQAGRPDAHLIETIDNVISSLALYCEIQAGYRILDVRINPGQNEGIFIGGSFFNMQKIVVSKLRKSEKAALFVCSIGPGMETWAKELMLGGEPLLSYIVDTVASIVVEKAVDKMHDLLGRQMDEFGLKITNRYSPGYCNWPVSDQQILFLLLPEKFCGVTLTGSSLMIPIKSVSGVIGIGASVKMKEYTCDTCGMKDCTYRSTRRLSSK